VYELVEVFVKRMIRRARVFSTVSIAIASTVFALAQSARPGTPLGYTPGALPTSLRVAAATPGTAIQHVVIIMKENRSFDEYFGRFPGADGATRGTMSNGQTVDLGETPDPMPNDINHEPTDWETAYHGGAMDGFDKEPGAFSASGQNLAYSQMFEQDIPNYWKYARRYGLGDRFFSAYKGASFANNLFAVAGQSGQYDSSLGGRYIYNLPYSARKSKLGPWGCDDPADTLVTMTTSDGSRSSAFPCFGFRSMPNILEESGVSWSMYGANHTSGFAHNALDSLRQIRYDPAMWSHVKRASDFTNDVRLGRLPAVTWIASPHNEHPPDSACSGENETVRYVNAIMNSPQWPTTAIFVFWDEWGGFYDHVAPPQIDSTSYGFRTPLLVISPYSKLGLSSDGGSVVHTFFSQESTLKFIETNWSLPSLTPRDQNANNMMDFFDFTAPLKQSLILAERSCPALPPALAAEVAEHPDDY
jgi:phospholipase C